MTTTTIKDNVDEEEEQLGEGGINVLEEVVAVIAAGLDFADDNNADINAVSIYTNTISKTLGMTNKRQKEIQGSLFCMVGHENDNNNNNIHLICLLQFILCHIVVTWQPLVYGLFPKHILCVLSTVHIIVSFVCALVGSEI